MDDGRVCTKCGQWKERREFGKAARNPEAIQSICKPCVKLRQKQWEAANRRRNIDGVWVKTARCHSCNEIKPASEFIKSKNSKRGISSTCAECSRVRDRVRYREQTERRKESAKWGNLKQKFGLTKTTWLLLFESQEGNCAVCGRTFYEDERVCVDHDHETGKIRGLTCVKCNMALGLFGDSSDVVGRAADYLRRHGR